MATENKLKELLQVAKASRCFEGMKEEDVWQACLVYRGKNDATIDGAILNINKEDARMREEEEKNKNVLELSHQKMEQIKVEEKSSAEEDKQKADDLLKQLMPSADAEKKKRGSGLWNFLTK